MRHLHLDFETTSELDLKKVGASKYASHQSTRVLCLAFAHDDEPVQTILWPTSMDISSLFEDDVITVIHAWNAAFERNILRHRYGMLPARWSCSMQRSLYAGFPARLEQAALAMRVPHLKDMAGHRLMLKMSKPKKDGTFWHDDPAVGKQMLCDLAIYCAKDVEAERALARRLPELPQAEQALSDLDAEVNLRGLMIDQHLVSRLIDISEQETGRLNVECARLTQWIVTSPGTQTARLLNWFETQGFPLESIDKESMAELLDLDEDELPDLVRQIALIRQLVAKSSTKKLRPMLNAMERDGRIRGTLQYYGAGRTGRWAGRIIQPQNLPSRGINKNASEVIEDIKSKVIVDADFVRTFHGDVMWNVSSCLRGCIVPAVGKLLLVFDFAQIEARTLAWLSGQKDLLRLFESGKDVYAEVATRLGLSSRDGGKVAVLSLGYGTGWKKFIQMAKGYGLELDEAESRRIVSAWRADNANTVQLWYDMQRKVIDLLRQPVSNTASVNGIELDTRPPIINGPRTGKLLMIRLPNRRRHLYYHNMRLETDSEGRDALVFDGFDPDTRQWGPIRTWGAKLIENVTQAAARDIMAEAALKVETAFSDVSLVLSVHDELVFEVEANPALARKDQILGILSQRPDWALDLPVEAGGKIMSRYGK